MGVTRRFALSCELVFLACALGLWALGSPVRAGIATVAATLVAATERSTRP